MMNVAKLYRHPIKSHGREAIETVDLTKGKTMPWDRTWAVTHAASKFDTDAPEWVVCRNFMIGSRAPGLVGIWATLDEAARRITLTHQDLGELVICPDVATDAARLVEWIAPLVAEHNDVPASIVKVEGRGMTDSAFPSISIMNTASHDAVIKALGEPITIERWRGNIWLDGLEPWVEHGWPGRDIAIGGAVLHVRERIKRCPVTNTNPITGIRDTATLDTLNREFGHQDFGIYAEVIQSGTVALGDTASVI